MFSKLSYKYGEYFYVVFRIFIGILFFMHGAQKLFGWFSDRGPVALLTLFGIAGIIEVVSGIFITLGLFTRVFASITAIEMLVAYFKVHIPQSYIPLLNGGEPALLFFASFLILLAYGAGKWNLGKALFKKEIL